MGTLLLPGTMVWLLRALAVSSRVLEAIAVLGLVDLASGIFHWLEDTFWTEKTPVLGRWVVTPNVIHHRSPSAFVDKSWLESSWDLAAFGGCIVATAWGLHCLTWHVWLFVVVGANANQIHKWTHVPHQRLAWPVRALQRMGLLQSAAHHAAHHGGEKNTAYCVITPWVNPVLDRLDVWRLLERLVVRPGAAPRRTDLANRPMVHTSSMAGLVLLTAVVLGPGSGCMPPRADDSAPAVLRVVAGPEAAGWYVRAVANALPLTRGLPCPTGFECVGGAADRNVPRPATRSSSTEEMLGLVSGTVDGR